MSDIKTLTVRLPISIYERAAGLAKARGRSMNRLVQDALRLLDSQESEKRLFDDFTRIAEADGGGNRRRICSRSASRNPWRMNLRQPKERGFFSPDKAYPAGHAK
ncbi:MAG: hypothetical protein GXX91_17015 [Verrucomicrobiaceae bacterium]|nr:hypothetical protein [Verrucomicrobiaceae bacterium]